jgi:acyl-coenzyme A synthetase/AMP-(fatty) acid ligase
LVHEAAVVGIWSPQEDTEIPRAFVSLKVADEQKSVEVSKEIADLVASKVSNYKKLRGGVVIIRALPRNSTGKLLKKKLKEYEVKSQHAERKLGSKL